MLRTLCAHPKPIVGFRSGARELADHPPTRATRDNPDIDQLKRQARELLEAYRAQSPDAIIEVAAQR